jgi:predicted Ser/Thr protein kinase
MYKKTGWFVPSIGKFVHKSNNGAISSEPLTFKAVPNVVYWGKLINKVGLEPGGLLTRFKSDSGHHVYYSIADGLFIYNADAKKIKAFKGAPRVRKLFMAAENANRFINLPKSPAKVPSPPKSTSPPKATYKKTTYKSTNGKNVYQFKNDYYVMKNGKFTKQFKGKTKLPTLKMKTPVVVSVPVEVPVVKPGASHTVAPKNARIAKLGLLLKAIAVRKKKLAGAKKVNHLTEYCQNFNKGYVRNLRKEHIQFYFPAVDGFSDLTADWKDSLGSLKWRIRTKTIEMSYDHHFAQQLVLKYYPAMKNFKNFNKENIIDMTWFQKQNKWLKSLSPREIFLMFGYSHNGDVWAHAYLDGKFNMKMFIDKVKSLTGNEYFAFFFQARDFYKISTGNLKTDYTEVLKRVRAEKNPEYIKSITQMFIDELSALCAKAPATTKPFVVWRGVKDDKYMTGIKDKQYTLNRFASTSVYGDIAVHFAHAGGSAQTVQRILVMPGSKCLLMFGTTKYDSELEILLPRGSTYIVRKTEKDVEPLLNSSWLCPGAKYPPQYNTSKHVNNLTDIILLGQSKRFKPATKAVTVPPAVLTNVEKMQKILTNAGFTNYKTTNKIGAGGYGSVFKATNIETGHKFAVKIQKNTKNYKTEGNALRNLGYTGVTPKLYAKHNLKWSQNAANLIPKSLAPGNKAGILVMNYINGKPLRNYMTGAPLNKALKNKVTKAVGKISRLGWIHGNLHRNNVIINKNGNPKIIDFGKAAKWTFTNTNGANKWLKSLGKGYVEKYGKKFYYSNNAKTRAHYSNKNFLNKLQ